MYETPDEKITSNVNSTNLSMYKNIIKLMETPNRANLSEAWKKVKEVDKGIKWKEFNSVKGRATYLENLKGKAAEAKPKKKTYTVSFRILTKTNDKLSGSLFQ